MIYYFSGTGNSKYVAQKIADDTGDVTFDMAEALKSGGAVIDTADDGPIGFVMPVYYGGIPVIVRNFIKRLSVDPRIHPYIYGVVTCGSSAGSAALHLDRALEEKGLSLIAFFSVKMPANYIALYDPPRGRKREKILIKADSEIETIEKSIMMREAGDQGAHRSVVLEKTRGAGRLLYNIMRRTSKFHADEKCVSCGLCAKICPDGAICMSGEGRPVWVKKRCEHCMACINRCPAEALQYGDKTAGRARYVNPNIDL